MSHLVIPSILLALGDESGLSFVPAKGTISVIP